jgi:prepilin peptidase CpaA
VTAIAPQLILWAISLCALLWGACVDLRLRIIPDRVSLIVAVSGLMIACTLRPSDIYASLTGFTVVFAGMCVLGYYDFVGGGDVKLIGAVSLLVPSSDIVVLLLEIALVGGFLSCVYLFAQSRLRKESQSRPGARPIATQSSRLAIGRSFQQEAARIIAGEPMPYAFAILGGVILHGARELYQCRTAVSCLF